MLSHALSASFADTSEQRASDRRVLRLEAQLATPAGQGGVAVHNLSRTGMLVECTTGLPVGTSIEVELPDGKTHRAEVVWADEGLVGCRFERPLSKSSVSAAVLRALPQASGSSGSVQPQDVAFTKLRERFAFEPVESLDPEPKFAVGARMWIIGGLALAAWAVPAAVMWMFW